jgi:hypothetical protein
MSIGLLSCQGIVLGDDTEAEMIGKEPLLDEDDCCCIVEEDDDALESFGSGLTPLNGGPAILWKLFFVYFLSC